MANFGNIFIQTLNAMLQQANYSDNFAMSRNMSLINANNPEYGVKTTKAYKNAIICGYTICENDDKEIQDTVQK